MDEQVQVVLERQADLGLAVAAASSARASKFRSNDRLRKQAEWRTAHRNHLNRYSKAWQDAHPESIRATHERRRFQRAIDSITHRSIAKSWPRPDFGVAHLAHLLEAQNARCDVCDRPMVMMGTRGAAQEDVWTIDRVDSAAPYNKDNIALICMRCNRIKNNGTAAEHRRIADWMLSKGAK